MKRIVRFSQACGGVGAVIEISNGAFRALNFLYGWDTPTLINDHLWMATHIGAALIGAYLMSCIGYEHGEPWRSWWYRNTGGVPIRYGVTEDELDEPHNGFRWIHTKATPGLVSKIKHAPVSCQMVVVEVPKGFELEVLNDPGFGDSHWREVPTTGRKRRRYTSGYLRSPLGKSASGELIREKEARFREVEEFELIISRTEIVDGIALNS